METRPAIKDDCNAIAELAMMAGEGIPAFFWEQSRRQGEKLLDVGARNAASETENFSYRNTHVAIIDGEIAGMLLAYRLPPAEQAEDLSGYPEFIRPLIELEQCVPGSFYINMLATYPVYRGQGVGTALMQLAMELAQQAGISIISVEVFEENEGALTLYKRLGYEIIEQRPVVKHSCHPYGGQILLLIRKIGD